MKRNLGINLLLISIAITTLGSVFKIMRQITISEILLGVGVVTFLVAIVMVLYKIFDRRTV